MNRARIARISVAGIGAGVLLAGGLAAGAGLTGARAAIAATARTARTAPDTITTFAGGVGGPDAAGNVSMDACGLRYAGGMLYVGTGNAVRAINPAAGRLHDVAGNGAIGDAAGNPPATGDALSGWAIYYGFNGISGACNVATDSHGNVVFADWSAIDVVAKRAGTFYGKHMRAGHLYTIYRFSDYPDGPAVDVEPDGKGNLLVSVDGYAESRTNPAGGAHVYVIAGRAGTFYGMHMRAGHRYRIVGTTILRGSLPANGQFARDAWLGNQVGNFRIDRHGNIVLADPADPPYGGYIGHGPNAAGSLVIVVAEKAGTFYGMRMRPHRIYLLAGNIGDSGHSGNGVPAAKSTLFAGDAVALDRHGNVLIADWGQVRVVAAAGGTFYGRRMRAHYIYTIAGSVEPAPAWPSVYQGNGGPARKAVFGAGAVAVDGRGNVVLTSYHYRVLVVASASQTSYGKRMRAGHIYSIAGNGMGMHSGDGGQATAAEFQADSVSYDRPLGLTVIPDTGGTRGAIRVVPALTGRYFGRLMKAGRIYTVATGNPGRPRSGVPAMKATLSFSPTMQFAATPQGSLVSPGTDMNVVQVIAQRAGRFYGRSMKTDHIYTIAGTGTAGYSGDGGPAAKAQVNDVLYVAADAHGNIVLSDAGRLRVVAARTGRYFGVAMRAGDIYTIAGNGTATSTGNTGPAAAATISPGALTLDGHGNIVVLDRASCEIRVVAARPGTFYGVAMRAGHIYAIAGDGLCAGQTTSGARATSVTLAATILGMGPAGSIVCADVNRVYVIPVKAGTYYGERMAAMHIYVVGGSNSPKLRFGNGGPARKASLNVEGLATTPAGAILIADGLNFRIRQIAP